MAPNELILEVREFLAENAYTCFFTNYALVHDGRQLGDYDDVSQLDLSRDNRIYMKPQLYTDKTARMHVQKIKDMLTRPKVLTQ